MEQRWEEVERWRRRALSLWAARRVAEAAAVVSVTVVELGIVSSGSSSTYAVCSVPYNLQKLVMVITAAFPENRKKTCACVCQLSVEL